jgi:hypothetical protein
MKKYIFLFALVIGLASIASAQSVTTMSLATGDTITNTGTASKVIKFTSTAAYGVSVQVNLSKISGTGAGTVQLQVSNDGVTWTNSGSAFTITNVATQAAYFTLAAPVPGYVRALCTGSGTESVVHTVLYRVPKL